MVIPEWLKEQGAGARGQGSGKKAKEKFLDKTLRHVVAFTEDTMFNEISSSRNGLLQKIEPGIKIVSILFFIIFLSLQKDIVGIGIFLALALILAFLSRVQAILIKRLMPVVIFTGLIALPAVVNLIVDGEPLFTIYSHVAVTRQGLLSAGTLLLRAAASVSFVFLLTLTTKPNRFIKAISSLMPDTLGSITSISYRYIFLLVRRVEQFIVGFKSRNISVAFLQDRAAGQGWVASRIGFLFSMSLRLSSEIGHAMEARGFREERFKIQDSRFKFSAADILWIIFSLIFMGGMLWRYSI